MKKDSIIFHRDWLPLVASLPDDKRLIFWDLFSQTSDPEACEDPFIKPIWVFICSQVNKMSDKYEARAERNRENGQKGGRPKTQNNPAKPKITQTNPSENPETLNGNVNVNSNDKDNKNVNKNENSARSAKDSPFFNLDFSIRAKYYEAAKTWAIREKGAEPPEDTIWKIAERFHTRNPEQFKQDEPLPIYLRRKLA
jgi:hypothetical protein